MDDDSYRHLIATSAASLLAIALVMAITCSLAMRWRKHSIVDVVWGLGFAVVAIVCFVSSSFVTDADDTRRTVIVAMTVLWGLRLATHISIRNRGSEDDPRYRALFRGGEPRLGKAITTVYLPQGVIMWFVSLPVQVAVLHQRGLGVIGVIGIAVWAIGLTFETVGDLQLTRFRADPANKGQVMDHVRWRYTRHPNYFGDACVWWGIFLVAAEHWPGVLTILSPAVMTYLLVAKTGKALLERSMQESKPGYAEYVDRMSGFVPLPPRRSSADERQSERWSA